MIVKKRYEFGMKQILNELDKYNEGRLLVDVEHILDSVHVTPTTEHNKTDKIRWCQDEQNCIHFKRAVTDRNAKEYTSLSLQEKSDLFNTDNPYDIIYVSMLSRVHCLLKHSFKNQSLQNKILALFRKDVRYTTYILHSIGVFVEYHSMYYIYYLLSIIYHRFLIIISIETSLSKS